MTHLNRAVVAEAAVITSLTLECCSPCVSTVRHCSKLPMLLNRRMSPGCLQRINTPFRRHEHVYVSCNVMQDHKNFRAERCSGPPPWKEHLGLVLNDEYKHGLTVPKSHTQKPMYSYVRSAECPSLPVAAPIPNSFSRTFTPQTTTDWLPVP